MQSPVLYTIGHSTRPLEAFIELLRSFCVQTLVDIRTVPRSRTNPQYNLDRLPEALAAAGLRHRRIDALGGLRKKSSSVPEATNGFWENRSFHNYADYALGEAFEAGLSELMALAQTERCAIMCAEAVWWRCHRRIVADYLLLRGVPVLHIMDQGKATEAAINPAARVQGDKLIYPAALATPESR